MTYHIINGDAMKTEFEKAGIDGCLIVFREGLVDGPLDGDDLDQLWRTRAAYMGIEQGEYAVSVVSEIDKILEAPEDSEFNLWFEFDLFCQVNMWFLLALLHKQGVTDGVYAVYTRHLHTGHKNFWNGFGYATHDDMTSCYHQRDELTASDIDKGTALWEAYRRGDLQQLEALSATNSSVFPHVNEVVLAHIDRFATDQMLSKVERSVAEIIHQGSDDFDNVFRTFWKTQSIYGFGDIQFRRIYDKVMRETH